MNARVWCSLTRRPTARAASRLAPMAVNRRPATVFFVSTATTSRAASANTTACGMPRVRPAAMLLSSRVVLRGNAVGDAEHRSEQQGVDRPAWR